MGRKRGNRKIHLCAVWNPAYIYCGARSCTVSCRNIAITLIDRCRSSSTPWVLCGGFQSGDHPLAGPELPGELPHAFPLRSQYPDFFHFRLSQPAPRWSSNMLSGSTCLSHSCDDSCPQHLALKFCDRSEHLKSQPTCWQCRVDVLFQRNKVHAQRFAFFGDGQQLSQ